MEIEKEIKSQILLKKSDMRLDKFLSFALFKKKGYYYNKKAIGIKNDFITSPEISQIFGEIIGLYLFYIWKTKINSKFNLIELGPGKATLFRDIANSVSKYPKFFENAEIKFIEINKELIKLQKENIKAVKIDKIKWKNKINLRSSGPSIIYSNEFFDCFPVRQFIFKNYWNERYVSLDKNSNNFYFKNQKVYNSKLLSLLNLYKKEKILEISFERNKYFENICKFIKNKGGIFLTVDYGYFENINYFTLQAIQNHKFSHVLENIGEKDISSHVNFKSFLEIAKNYDLNIEEFCTQRDFLIKYGILERKKILLKSKNSNQINIDVQRLIDKKNMGSLFKFLIISNL